MARRRRDYATIPMPELRLYHSAKKCAKFLGKHGIDFNPIEGTDADTWTFYDSGSYAVVYFPKKSERDYWDDMGLLAHEATHIMLWALSRIGEEDAGEEEMAYVTQAIASWLCKAHFEWKERRIAKKSATM